MQIPNNQEHEQFELMVDSTIQQPIQPYVPICKVGDLDNLLDDDLKKKFKGLFYDEDGKPLPIAWRMFYDGNTPEKFLSEFGIDIDKPKFRDAVAFDLVKLDDSDSEDIGGMSNDWDCEYQKHLGYSPMEYERMILHRNYRTNMVHSEPEFTMIQYEGEEEPKARETMDFMYQGVRLSDVFLTYFSKIKGMTSNEEAKLVSVPITTKNDIMFEMALIPNVHPDFRA